MNPRSAPVYIRYNAIVTLQHICLSPRPGSPFSACNDHVTLLWVYKLGNCNAKKLKFEGGLYLASLVRPHLPANLVSDTTVTMASSLSHSCVPSSQLWAGSQLTSLPVECNFFMIHCSVFMMKRCFRIGRLQK